MLIISRKEGEAVRIGDAVVRVLSVSRTGVIRLGVDAPAEVSIIRTEIDKEAIDRD